jgi:hypothetical protein
MSNTEVKKENPFVLITVGGCWLSSLPFPENKEQNMWSTLFIGYEQELLLF